MTCVIVGIIAAVIGFAGGLIVAVVAMNNLFADMSDEDNYAEFYDPGDYEK